MLQHASLFGRRACISHEHHQAHCTAGDLHRASVAYFSQIACRKSQARTLVVSAVMSQPGPRTRPSTPSAATVLIFAVQTDPAHGNRTTVAVAFQVSDVRPLICRIQCRRTCLQAACASRACLMQVLLNAPNCIGYARCALPFGLHHHGHRKPSLHSGNTSVHFCSRRARRSCGPQNASSTQKQWA